MLKHVKRTVFSAVISLIALMFIGLTPVSAANHTPRIVIVETLTLAAVQERSQFLIQHLDALGYRNGDTAHIEIINAQKDMALAKKLLSDSVQSHRPDVVVTVGTLAAKAAKVVLKGTGIPQAFFLVSDPVGAGLISAIGEASGSNITGIVHILPQDKIFDLVFRLVRQTSPQRPFKVGLVHTSYPSSQSGAKHMIQVASTRSDFAFTPFRITQRTIPADMPAMIHDTLDGLKAAPDDMKFLWVSNGPIQWNTDYINALVHQSGKTVLYASSMEAVRQGVLMTLASDAKVEAREISQLVDSLIKGRDAAVIPVLRSAHFIVGLNMTTALKLGIIVPPDILEIAAGHIYR